MADVTPAILSISCGSPPLVVVGLKPIQGDPATARSLLALAGSLVWIGTGGIVMGRVADRVGMRATAVFGVATMATVLALSALGRLWAVFIGHGPLVGFFGNGTTYPPPVVYVSRWFDRRRGTAVAPISCGRHLAGVIWTSLFEPSIARFAWPATMPG